MIRRTLKCDVSECCIAKSLIANICFHVIWFKNYFRTRYFLRSIKIFNFLDFFLCGRIGAESRGCTPGICSDTQIQEDFLIRHLVYHPEASKVVKNTKTLRRMHVCIELHSPNLKHGARTMAPWRALRPIPLKGRCIWVRSLSMMSYGCSPAHLHNQSSHFMFY